MTKPPRYSTICPQCGDKVTSRRKKDLPNAVSNHIGYGILRNDGEDWFYA